MRARARACACADARMRGRIGAQMRGCADAQMRGAQGRVHCRDPSVRPSVHSTPLRPGVPLDPAPPGPACLAGSAGGGPQVRLQRHLHWPDGGLGRLTIPTTKFVTPD